MSNYASVLLVNFTDRLVNQNNHVPEYASNLDPGKNLKLCEFSRLDVPGAVTKLLTRPITDPVCQHVTHQVDCSDMAFSILEASCRFSSASYRSLFARTPTLRTLDRVRANCKSDSQSLLKAIQSSAR